MKIVMVNHTWARSIPIRQQSKYCNVQFQFQTKTKINACAYVWVILTRTQSTSHKSNVEHGSNCDSNFQSNNQCIVTICIWFIHFCTSSSDGEKIKKENTGAKNNVLELPTNYKLKQQQKKAAQYKAHMNVAVILMCMCPLNRIEFNGFSECVRYYVLLPFSRAKIIRNQCFNVLFISRLICIRLLSY